MFKKASCRYRSYRKDLEEKSSLGGTQATQGRRREITYVKNRKEIRKKRGNKGVAEGKRAKNIRGSVRAWERIRHMGGGVISSGY